MFWSRNKKIDVYPCKPVFLYKSGIEGGQNYKLMIFSFFFFFFFFFSRKRICHFMQIVPTGDNLHEMSKPVF